MRVQDPPIIIIPFVGQHEMSTEIVHRSLKIVGTLAEGGDASLASEARVHTGKDCNSLFTNSRASV